MHLYNLTVKRADAVVQALAGNFSGTRQQELLISHGTALEILRLDVHTEKLSSIVSADVFGSIRSLASFRLPGNTKDYIVVGSDSGRLVILEFCADTASFVKLHQETFGKTGARRIVPGQFLATDPHGRCVMIAAIESSKLVYTLNRDAALNLTISSPLEAHSPGTAVHHIVGLDVGFENPMFAALEIEYGESDPGTSSKMLAFYELDLGLNHVLRKWRAPTDPRANMLISVPADSGTASVLICCEDSIIYHRIDTAPHRVSIPRRKQHTSRGLLIVAATMHKMKDGFFFLLQSEVGDLYKVTLDYTDLVVHALKIKYFGTVPVSYLFAASEFGDQYLYRFQTLGEDDDEAEYSSAAYPSLGMADPTIALPRVHFDQRPLRNLALTDEAPALNPIIQSKLLEGAPHSSPQILAACGRGPRSTLRILQLGLAVDEIVRCDVRASPNGLWVTKRTERDEKDTYIVLSFANATLVFSIGDELVEVQDTGFLSSVPSLAIQQLGADSLVQVHPAGLRHVSATGQLREWAVPPGKTIINAATNKRQIAVALSSAEIVYFEVDLDGQLNEYQERKAMGSAVLTLGLAEVEEGHQRTPYLAVGCEDQTIRILSLDPEHTLENVGLQALISPPSAICIVRLPDSAGDIEYIVHIGLANGVLLRTVLDTTNGTLTDTRSRFVGSRAVRLSRVILQKAGAVLVLSTRPWIYYTHNGQQRFAPLLYDELQYGCNFSHEMCEGGLAAIVGNELRIFKLTKINQQLNQRSIPLSHTPRQMVSHPKTGYVYIAESDHRVIGDMSIEREKGDEESLDMSDEDYRTFGRPSASAGSWSSCVRVVDPVKERTVALIHLAENEAAFSVAIVPFAALQGELLLVVGTATDVVMEPRSCSSGFLRTYKITDSGELELSHTTEIADIPLKMVAFRGRLLAGIGKSLRIYEMGKQKLLRKAENDAFATTIVTLNVEGSRIVVGDMQQSLTVLAYMDPDCLVVVADDTQARWTTCSTMVDYNTAVVGDRFGNIFVNRLDSKISDRLEHDDGSGLGITREKGQLNGAPHKTEMIAHFHVGDIITSVHKVALVARVREVLLYTGLHGTIGILVPLLSREDVDFLSNLEQHIRAAQTSLVGRDHLSWRGYYAPVKRVIDGDLCESFSRLLPEKRRAIAGELNYTVGEVLKKVEQIRMLAGIF
ncbi:CPSF A subunit region-domain-containing protein [Mycena galericulata]|nr:CPSF A subunit region-domain-containing protein [Mycena galericulata]